MFKYNAQLFLIFLITLLNGCINDVAGENMNGTLYTLPTECDFRAVGNNAEEEFDCSPQLLDRYFSPFQGLLINGPKDVTWPKDFDEDNININPMGDTSGPFKLMIAGLVKLPYNTMDLRGNFGKHIVLIAINQKTAQPYSGKMSVIGITDDGPDIDTAGYGDSKQYFNIDLVQNLEIPITNATYTVYATLGDYKSNVLTVQTIVK
jgi:hypothetical protein